MLQNVAMNGQRIVLLPLFGLEVTKFDDILAAVHFYENHQGLRKRRLQTLRVVCTIDLL